MQPAARTSSAGADFLPRRKALAWLAAAGAGCAGLANGACAPPVPGGSISAAEVYVGLGKARQVAILDAASDRVVGRVELESFGDRGAPAQIGVGPGGEAAVLPLVSNSPSIALIQQPTASAAAENPTRRPGARRASWLRLGPGREPRAERAISSPEAAQRLAADARGNAYIVVGAGTLSDDGPALAVVELSSGAIKRRHRVGAAGEAVTALFAEPDGTRVYAAVWRWAEFTTDVVGSLTPASPGSGSPVTRPIPSALGRLVALDPVTGAVLAKAPLPANAAVTELTMASGPPGSHLAGQPCLYAAVQQPGPLKDESLSLSADRTYQLVALDPQFLDVVATWPLRRSAGSFAVTSSGARAYLLGGAGLSATPTRELVCVDLTTGHPIRRWQLPDGCFSMTLSSVGKLYVADALGDRLWRVDVARNVMLPDISLPGAPLTVASRPN